MNEALTLTLSGVVGVWLGAVFFGGLWWTVRRCISLGHPALWFLASSLCRTAVVLAGFYFVADGDWLCALACLLGFLCARYIILRLTRPPEPIAGSLRKEAGNAP